MYQTEFREESVDSHLHVSDQWPTNQPQPGLRLMEVRLLLSLALRLSRPSSLCVLICFPPVPVKLLFLRLTAGGQQTAANTHQRLSDGASLRV